LIKREAIAGASGRKQVEQRSAQLEVEIPERQRAEKTHAIEALTLPVGVFEIVVNA